jgi:hypothetical protein
LRSLQDVIYNWLTIKLVVDSRPDDQAAAETEKFFWHMLQNEHHVNNVQYDKKDEMYVVICQQEGKLRNFRFPLELIECINEQIKNNPDKYPTYNN